MKGIMFTLLFGLVLFAEAQTQFIRPLPVGYSQAVGAEGKFLFISGQISVDATGHVIGKNDLRAQTVQVYENIKSLLNEAGCTYEDVVKMNIYIVNYKPEHGALIREVRKNYLSDKNPPASTLVGVTSLFHPDYLIEIEAVALMRK